jgi:hypothetical protein
MTVATMSWVKVFLKKGSSHIMGLLDRDCRPDGGARLPGSGASGAYDGRVRVDGPRLGGKILCTRARQRAAASPVQAEG